MDAAQPASAVAAEHPGSLSLESRLGLLRRRRHRAVLRHSLIALGPVLLGMSLFLVLAVFGAVAGLR
jgi:hypothetical protein